MLFAPIAGRISDRVGPLRVALTAGIGLLIVTLIYAIPLPSWAMLTLLVAIGPLFTTLATTIFPLAASGADEEGLGHGAAYALLGIGWSLGFVIGPATAGRHRGRRRRRLGLRVLGAGGHRAAGARRARGAPFWRSRPASARSRLTPPQQAAYHACWHSVGESANPQQAFCPHAEVGMNLKPLGDRVIVEVLEEEQTTASGIVLPGHGQGEAAARPRPRRRPGPLRGREARPARRRRRRRGHLSQVRRHRGQGRRRGLPDPARVRHPRQVRPLRPSPA